MTSILPIPPQHRVQLVKNYAKRHWQKGGGWDLIVEGCVPDAEIILVTKSANTERGVLVLMSRQLKSLTSEQVTAMLKGERTLLTVKNEIVDFVERKAAEAGLSKTELVSAIKAEVQFAKDQARENELMRKILGIYCQLSPEALHCDGEISAAAAQRKANKLYKELDAACKELGREVSEDEAYAWENANPVRPFEGPLEVCTVCRGPTYKGVCAACREWKDASLSRNQPSLKKNVDYIDRFGDES